LSLFLYVCVHIYIMLEENACYSILQLELVFVCVYTYICIYIMLEENANYSILQLELVLSLFSSCVLQEIYTIHTCIHTHTHIHTYCSLSLLQSLDMSSIHLYTRTDTHT
jgi:hypothetical protein